MHKPWYVLRIGWMYGFSVDTHDYDFLLLTEVPTQALGMIRDSQLQIWQKNWRTIQAPFSLPGLSSLKES